MKDKRKNNPGRPVADWTKERIAELKKIYPTTPNQEAAKKLGISVSALRNAAQRFKVKKSNRYWDKPEEKFVIESWDVMSPEEIAAGLRNKFKTEKTKWAVINKYRELQGLR